MMSDARQPGEEEDTVFRVAEWRIRAERRQRRIRVLGSVAGAAAILLAGLFGAAGLRGLIASRCGSRCETRLSLTLPPWAIAADSSVSFAVSIDGRLHRDSLRAGGQMLLTLGEGSHEIGIMAPDPCWVVDPPQPMWLSIQRGQRVVNKAATLKPMGAFQFFANKGDPDSLWVIVNGVRRGPVARFEKDARYNYLVPLCAGESEVRIVDAQGADVVQIPARVPVPRGTTTHVLTEVDGWRVSY